MNEHYFRVFLGITEEQIDAEPTKPFGATLHKGSKKMLNNNMYMVQYFLSDTQSFELFFDMDEGGSVTSQRSFLPNIEKEYDELKKQSIPSLGVAYSDGFFIQNNRTGRVLFELLSIPNYPSCIMTSL